MFRDKPFGIESEDQPAQPRARVLSPHHPEEEAIHPDKTGTRPALNVVHNASRALATVQAEGTLDGPIAMPGSALVPLELVRGLEVPPTDMAVPVSPLLVAVERVVRGPHRLAPSARETVHVLEVCVD